MSRRGDWIQTYTGRQYWPLDPSPDDVCAEDIAHSLSLLCRFNGHCIWFYSVAEHSCLVADNVPEEFKLEALLHDASEAYLADVPRPVKPELQGYRILEKMNQDAVCDHFGVTREHSDIVKETDTRLLFAERKQNMGYRLPWAGADVVVPLDVQLHYWSPITAEIEFMTRLHNFLGREFT